MGRILLGVSGGMAAYKSVELVRLAVKAGHAVRVIETEAATHFVGLATFAAVSGAPVLTSVWERDPARGAFPGDPLPDHDPLAHLALAEHADVLLVAPATADVLARLAAGLADDLLTTTALACRRPLVVAPAMNDAMLEHPATRATLETLRRRGVTVLDSAAGPLGSLGEWGAGRMAEPTELLAACEAAMRAADAGNPRDLAGLDVLVSAGGTREPIDAVRFVGNRSSGRMGIALAEEAVRRGARVTLVAANVSRPVGPGIELVAVERADELAAALAARFPAHDVLLMAAAVADYRPVTPYPGKLTKGEDADALRTLALEPTPDVIAGLAAGRRPDQTVIGFAAEHGAGGVERGRGKLRRKGLNAVVVNDVGEPGIGFDSPDNAVTLVTADGVRVIPRTTKAEIARAICDFVLSLRSDSEKKLPS